jgi:hypothetical protein
MLHLKQLKLSQTEASPLALPCSQAHLILMVGLADESRPAGMERTTAWLLNALEGLGGPSVQLQYQGKLVCLQWPRDRSKQAIGQLQDLVKSLVEVQGKWGNVSATVSELRLIDKLRPWCEGNLLSHKWSTYPFAPSKRLLLLTGMHWASRRRGGLVTNHAPGRCMPDAA